MIPNLAMVLLVALVNPTNDHPNLSTIQLGTLKLSWASMF
jgi:hypothetical protein